MSGWRRLWIVLSIILGALAFLAAYDANSSGFAEVKYTDGMSNAAFWQKARESSALSDCDWTTAKADAGFSDSMFVTCTNKNPAGPAFLWALAPAAFMAAAGLTIRWIYRGFRSPKK